MGHAMQSGKVVVPSLSRFCSFPRCMACTLFSRAPGPQTLTLLCVLPDPVIEICWQCFSGSKFTAALDVVEKLEPAPMFSGAGASVLSCKRVYLCAGVQVHTKSYVIKEY